MTMPLWNTQLLLRATVFTTVLAYLSSLSLISATMYTNRIDVLLGVETVMLLLGLGFGYLSMRLEKERPERIKRIVYIAWGFLLAHFLYTALLSAGYTRAFVDGKQFLPGAGGTP